MRFYAGMAERHGITGEVADRIYESWRRSPISVSRKVIRCHSPRWCSTRPGSSCTIRRPSALRCCGHSRWGSTPRSRWLPMPAGTGLSYMGPTSMPVLRTPRWRTADSRFGWGLGRSVTSVTTWPLASSPSARPAAPASLLDLTGRVQLSVPQVESMATAGALGCFGLARREALWAAGAAAAERPDRLPGWARRRMFRPCPV